MNSEEVITLYETVAVITDQMVTAAREGNWERLAELETRCASHVATLKEGEATAPLPPVSRERKARIIQKILADDREIRSLTEPWMNELSALINNTGTQRKLSRTYGKNQ
ncbi:flagellar protein FliT [Noviherbaspirillum cavernae]|uniref:Flagellar protein FliT n=1 Tax=Noviherbaspirillum cavernae TaxID=2320862 RepID=A0A418X0E2_9BURK|nr:flagellar protein FliT [Noviherbaspirillum cavernae]RJG05964.1 flagellar protein FliT [Noviherbaspirillum cavernae]